MSGEGTRITLKGSFALLKWRRNILPSSSFFFRWRRKKKKSSLINSFASSETEKNARSFIPFFSNFLRLDGIHGPPPSRRYICTKKGEESAKERKKEESCVKFRKS